MGIISRGRGKALAQKTNNHPKIGTKGTKSD
jgi:hypothetical protein